MRRGVLRSPAVISAFEHVDRQFFVREHDLFRAYDDTALGIGHEATISQPTVVAMMLEELDVKPGQRVLDVGSGSGWTTALLANLVGPAGRVVAVELVPELVLMGKQNVGDCPWVSFHQAMDTLGWPPEAPYDRILVSAAASRLPQALVAQLAPEGVMVLPVEGSIWRVRKDATGRLWEREYPGYRFVPLIGA